MGICGLFYFAHAFFFFQAEDGIRDSSVTGVQTCALPIWSSVPARHRRPLRPSHGGLLPPGSWPSPRLQEVAQPALENGHGDLLTMASGRRTDRKSVV